MRALLLALLVVLATTGATCQRRDPQAPVADAPPECRRGHVVSIDPPDTGLRWTCDAERAACWDELGERVVPELTAIALAEARGRQACVGFIDDLVKRGVIRVKP